MQAPKWLPSWASKGLGFVAPTTEYSSGITFDAKGIRDVPQSGGSNPMAIARPGGGKDVSVAAAMGSYTGWVYAAIRAIADEVSNMQFKLIQVKADGQHEEQHEHELLDLLDGVNEQQTGPEFKHTIVSHLELTGNAYLLLHGVSNFTDQPDAMYTLNPANVKILIDKTSFPFKIVGYEFNYGGKKPTVYQPYEVVHIKYPDPNDAYDGLGTVQAVAPWIDGDNYAMEFNRQYFIRGSKTGPVFESEAVDADAINRLRATYEAAHQGVDNAHRPLILPKGFKVPSNPMGSGSKDMDFSNFMDNMRDRILAGFRVSKTILGTAESDTNRSTAETADYVFSKRTIKPKMQLIISYLNEFLAPRYGADLYISFLDTTPEDKSFRIQEMQAVMGSEPVMSLNEAREKYQGLGPVDGGDEVMISNQKVPLGSPEKIEHPGNEQNNNPGKGQKSTKNMTTKDLPSPIRTHGARVAKARAKMRDAFAASMAKRLERINETKTKDLSEDDYMVVWQKFVVRVTEYEKQLHAGLVKINDEQEQEVLENLKLLFGEKNIAKKTLADLFDKKKWIKAVTDMATPILTDLASKESIAAALAYDKPGIDVTTDPNAAAALDQAIGLMSESYTQTTMDQLKEKISEGLAQNTGYDTTADLVSGIYEFADQYRANMVARTETFRVANSSTKASWKQIGVQTIKWYTAEDGDVCPFCQEQDGKIISIDDNFFDKGDSSTVDGQTMTFDYADVGAPPLHPNCRCYQRPEDLGSLE